MKQLTLSVLPQRLAVCRFPPSWAPPPWIHELPLWSVTRTDDELSLVVAPISAHGLLGSSDRLGEPVRVEQESHTRALSTQLQFRVNHLVKRSERFLEPLLPSQRECSIQVNGAAFDPRAIERSGVRIVGVVVLAKV